MSGHAWNSETQGGYYKQGTDITPEQKQEAADAGAQATQAKLVEFGASFPDGDLAGVLEGGKAD